MYAVTGILTRPDTQSSGQFRDYWLNGHAQVARQLPGLRRYYILPFDIQKSMGDGTWLATPPVADGVATLWFDDRAAALAAFASSAGSRDSQEFRASGVTALTFGGTAAILLE